MIKVAIIGGGVAGSSLAYYLSQFDIKITLFEKNSTLISGPPFCHLHAGGNLYPQISDSERVTLLRQSIEFAKFFPFAIEKRPTLITIPTRDETSPKYLIDKLTLLKKEYKKLIDIDKTNAILGDYYKLYSKEELFKLSKNNIPQKPTTLDSWIIPAAKYLNLEKLKEPLALVNEYGINIFALSGALNETLKKIPNVSLKLNSEVVDVKKDDIFTITYKTDNIKKESFDFLVNAAGFAGGKIDKMLGFNKKRFVEFKAAYLAKWDENPGYFPEIIFHGKRGTNKGMGQFTPYSSNLFQIHFMSKKATLFDDGLVEGKPEAILSKKFLELIESDWNKDEYEQRTKEAINNIINFIPAFKSAKPAAKPLFGAQQILGDNPELRAADVSFEGDNYARCEIVKANSVIDTSKAIANKIQKLGAIKQNSLLKAYPAPNKAEEIAKKRNYPPALSKIVYPFN